MAKEKKRIPIPVTEPTQEELQNFKMRSDFIVGWKKPHYKEIDIEKFFEVMFRRPGDKRWPFECEGCDEYNQWDKKHDEWVKGLREWREAGGSDDEYIEQHKIDYSDVAKHVYNPIILNFVPAEDEYGNEMYNENGDLLTKPRRYIVMATHDNENRLMLDYIKVCEGSYFAITSPVLYRGWNRGLKNAQRCYGIGIDLDFITRKEYMMTILGLMVVPHPSEGRIIFPKANIITNSGHGLHLYFLFEKPVDIHSEDQQKLMKKLKHGLIDRLWSRNTLKYQTTERTKSEDVQYQGITQGFRVPGSLTKFQSVVRSYACSTQHYFTVAELNSFVPKDEQLSAEEVLALESGSHYDPTKTKLSVAMVKWPDWYQRRIIEGQPPTVWHSKRHLYDFFMSMLRTDGAPIAVGHRYYILRSIAAMAVKCQVSYEEFKKDVMSFVPWFKSMGVSKDTEFRDSDVEDALECYYDPKIRMMAWETILKNCGLGDFYGSNFRRINPKDKKQPKKQKLHLKLARGNRDILCEEKGKENWWDGGGRRVETLENSRIAAMVRQWMIDNPGNKNKSQCARDLTEQLRDERTKRVEKGKATKVGSVTRKTVAKWWSLLDGTSTENQTVKETKSTFFDELKQLMDDSLITVIPNYQMELTADEMHSAMSNPDDPNYHKIWRKKK